MADLRYFEDIEPGESVRSGPVAVTREAILAFAQIYDPQPFHLDEAAASDSLLGGLAASGWHTTAMGMRLFYEGFVRHVASMGAPGIDEARWLRPVRPGDQLSLVTTIVDKRVSASRPDRGFLAIALDLRNGADDSVMTQRFSMIVQRRGTGHAASVSAYVPPLATGSSIPPADPTLTAFYEDAEIGHETQLGSQLFTPEAIITFATAYDPQYFHLDAEAAKASHFGGLIASGWQTAAFWMKHYIAARTRSTEARESARLSAAVGGPSPGFNDLKWIRPVQAGDTITYSLKVTGKRPTSRAGQGLILTENTGRTADGTLVFSFEGRLIWPMAAKG
ncbi:MaoC/PaaZ C-terminal domain-containing protein [Beijerinckia sp. L45]|uniref:MaoC/PaaZ C-terminal domain-containing protein n=1 Tax=Beijerinckia sp. L45 TaxID=1641855 RepID=UPI00131DEDF6|nr:MaoC/PaaZ C-terminal domain-containing protein [Beijerinckia sp. L45]